MRILRVKNYEKYQNHRAKNPDWIKLYRTLLIDRDFLKLHPTDRYVYVGLLILASETDNTIVNDPSYIAHRLSIDGSQLNLTPLFRSGLLCASPSTLKRINVSQRREETETEKISPLPSLQEGHTHKRGKRAITDEDKPTDKHFNLGNSLSVDVGPEWGKFKNYCLAHDKRYANFEAAFRNWLVNAADMKARVHAVR